MKDMPLGKRFVKGISGNPNGRPNKAHFEDASERWKFYRFGIRNEDYERMLKEQGGKCAICGRSETGGRKWLSGRITKFAVDHKHVEGYESMPPEEKKKYVRGLLCVSCNNRVLGLIEDNPELVIKAQKYLESFR